MRHPVWIALALASALSLAGCGGGGNPTPPTLATVGSVNASSTAPSAPPGGGFKAVVSFGDSLSDMGSYTLAAVSTYSAAPYNIPFTGLPYPAGGQFTVNGAPTGNWVGDLATHLGLTITPNIIGYGTPQGVAYMTPAGVTPDAAQAVCAFSAPPASGQANCLAFGQGGSMVSNPNGIGHSTGALTVPVTQQVQNYLAQFSSFNSSQLITVLAGNNDIFTALGTVSATVTQAVTQAVQSALAQNPGLTQAQIAAIQAQAQHDATSQAVAVAQATVAQAADQLVAQVKTITNDGGKYVMVYTLPDSSQTPFGRGLPYTGYAPPQAPPAGYVCDNTNTTTPCYLLSNLVQVFNQQLLTDLQGLPVKVLDGYSLLNQEVANPAQFGLSNATTPWCDPATQSSLLCNIGTPYAAAGASTSNLGTWLFADSVHPTPTGYQIIANATLSAMKGFGWTQ